MSSFPHDPADELFDVEVEVHFLQTHLGGLRHGLQSGHWAHFHYGNENWHVWLFFRDAPWVFPGESQVVFLRFKDPLAHLGRLEVGTPFVLCGPRPFAYGKVTAALHLERNAEAQLAARGEE